MKSIFPKAAVVMAMSLLVSCVTQESQVVMQQKEGYALTDDGVKISYELIGPSDAPVLWVGYPWSKGWAELMAKMTEGNLENDTVNDQLLQRLSRKYQVLYVDYPRGVGRTTGPLPGDLLPETAAKDYDAVAEAAGIEKFVALGFSWGGALGVQVALHSERCAGLAIGGWPVLGAPFEEIIPQVISNTAVLPPGRAKNIYASNVNFYKASLAGWDDTRVLESLSDKAGLLYLYIGSEDVAVPEAGLDLPLAERIIDNKERLENGGWKVDVFEGYDPLNLPMDVWVTGVLDFLEGKAW